MLGGTIARIMQKSDAGDAVLTTEYKEDYIVRGNSFQVQARISLASAATVYLGFNPTTVGSLRIFTLPLSLFASNGSVFLDTYIADSFTGGTVMSTAKLNPTSAIDPLATMYTGVTPVGGSLYPREYLIGSLKTNQSAGGGSAAPDVVKIARTDKVIIFKFVNQETSVNVVSLGFTWYEV